MISISSSATQPETSGTWDGLVRRIGIWASALAAVWERRAAIKALREMDDRQLRDIGVARCHIETAVGGALNPEVGRLR
jgi:uncharacterized protein YjiS (DUF1127 family)